jgi:quercetin dioxygenase-like cupin family protein
MDKVSLTALGRQHLAAAHDAHSGRSAHTVYGGHQHTLRQTLIALTAGTSLDDHDSPGEATLQVLAGRVRLTSPDTSWDGRPGDHLVIPSARHGLTPSTTASFCSPSPNLFSGKASPTMATVCLEGVANRHGPDLLHAATAKGSDHRQRRFRRLNLFDRPVIRRPVGWLVVRLVDRFGVRSGSWSR